jgi:uncharacterized protein with PIN domain
VIVDTSALIAILRAEPEAAACAAAIEAASACRISAAKFLDAAIVIDGSRDPIASRRFDDLIREAQLVIEPVTEVQARIARSASWTAVGGRSAGLLMERQITSQEIADAIKRTSKWRELTPAQVASAGDLLQSV